VARVALRQCLRLRRVRPSLSVTTLRRVRLSLSVTGRTTFYSCICVCTKGTRGGYLECFTLLHVSFWVSTQTIEVGDTIQTKIVWRSNDTCATNADGAAACSACRASVGLTLDLAFPRYSFTSGLMCTNQPSFNSPRPPALPTLVQYYCTTTGQYTPSPPTSRFHAIHHIILETTISCKGQPLTRSRKLQCTSLVIPGPRTPTGLRRVERVARRSPHGATRPCDPTPGPTPAHAK